MRLPILFVLLAGPALAGDVTATNCSPSPTGGSELMLVECDLSNGGGAAIASVDFHLVVAEPGRSVPWIDRIAGAEVPGGVEPGETRRLVLYGRPVEDGFLAKPSLSFTVEIQRASDAAGNPIP